MQAVGRFRWVAFENPVENPEIDALEQADICSDSRPVMRRGVHLSVCFNFVPDLSFMQHYLCTHLCCEHRRRGCPERVPRGT